MISSKFAWRALIYAAGDIITSAINLALVIVYTRYLSTDDYGVLSTINAVIAALFAFHVLGLNDALFRLHYDGVDEEQRRKIYGSVITFALFWATLVSVVLVIAGAPLFNQALATISFSPYVQLGLIIALGNSLLAFPLIIAQASGNALQYRILTIALGLSNLAAAILSLMIYKGHVYELLIANTFSMWFVMGLGYALNRKHIRFTLSPIILREALALGLPMAGFAIGRWLTGSFSRIVIEGSVGTAEVGYFSIASYFAQIYGLIFTAIGMARGPAFFEANLKKLDLEENANYVAMIVAAALGLGLFFIGTVPIGLPLIATDQYLPAVRYVPLALATEFFSGPMVALFTPLFFLSKRTLTLMWLILASGLCNIAVNMLLAPSLGTIGVALSACISNMLLVALLVKVSQGWYRAVYPVKKLFLLVLVAIFCASGMIYASNAHLLWLILVTSITLAIYGFVVIQLKIISIQNLLSLWQLLREKLKR